MTTRRRFLAISAAAATFPSVGSTASVYTWQGVALGARATLRLEHTDAKAISERVASEISRLEDIFSLYRPDSSLMQLNQTGRLDAPPFELLECLTLAGAVHKASEGQFDVTIQPLWACYADASVLGQTPERNALSAALSRTGWAHVRFHASSVQLKPDMALTLNGIAQGYIADRVAVMLEAEGLTNVLVDTGEYRALGSHPNGRAWPVKLAAGGEVPLASRALATSAPLGTTFDTDAQVGHILDPRTGLPAPALWKEISISAGSAALADALSTAACLCESEMAMEQLVEKFAGTRIEAAVPFRRL
ncbi:FAD:protein FMN transferase [Sulfitobacter sp. F26169L]|uniref:FAD:protein FMN transferase n=1 Tax=Sulfitobacter sp. F26169L TaxID=2996015 RepID=UPI0022608B76|nr:FAD:protein FMN transferase [Sulfitobacter sp. F26169L]MCX7567756.1 FAD:protein FMN transferase [Sulfitobacter sp. F26169L]